MHPHEVSIALVTLNIPCPTFCGNVTLPLTLPYGSKVLRTVMHAYGAHVLELSYTGIGMNICPCRHS